MAIEEPAHQARLDSSREFAAVTPSDETDFDTLTRGLYVGGAGNVVVVDYADNPVTFTAVPAGTVLPVRARRVNATSTTATAIVALF